MKSQAIIEELDSLNDQGLNKRVNFAKMSDQANVLDDKLTKFALIRSIYGEREKARDLAEK